MTRVQHLREQAIRAERLAKTILDAVTVTRLVEASHAYRQEADRLEQYEASDQATTNGCLTS
ncbi:hypothetical protein AB7714_29745 [Tardiphaga sp. 1201_B9_N1_1]|jgi:hypothetical protein|uniref:hypothetical protein n=1 Tax=unclassified Tardiphaga TaxID=2631404 RepID=UPI000E76936E